MKKVFEPSKVSPISKLVLVPYFGLGSIVDPHRGDLVAGLGDITAEKALKKIYNKMITSSDGRRLLREKRYITNDLLIQSKLSTLPPDSLGYQYYQFMDKHGYEANDRTPVRFIEDPDLKYIMTRYRQIHDFWHVLCDLPTNVLGEVSLKWFEWYVTGLPSCLLSGTLGPIKITTSTERIMLLTSYYPWARRAARQCEDLMSYHYEDNLHINVDKIRKELKIEPSPRWKY